MLEYNSSLAGETYLNKHHVKEFLSSVLEQLAHQMPDDPMRFIGESLNRHRVGSDQTQICPNPWCEQLVAADEFEAHAKQCRSDRWTKCIRCDTRVEVARMHQHRLNCHLVSCSMCGEYVFPRMLDLCPLRLLRQAQTTKRISASAMSSGRSSPARVLLSSPDKDSSDKKDLIIRKSPSQTAQSTSAAVLQTLQTLWRRRRARKAFTDVAFQGIWNLMDIARESRVAKSASLTAISQQGGSDHSSPTMIGTTPTASCPTSDRGSSFSRKGSVDSSQSASGQASPIDPEKAIAKEYTEAFRGDILKMIEARDVVEYPIALKIINDTAKILASRPIVVHLETPADGEVIVVGDIHGQLKDLLHILSTKGLPGPKTVYIFNGDFVDRGPYGMEVLLCVYVLLCSFPGSVQLNRGNHEDFKTNSEYGFHEEILSKYDDSAQEIIDAVTRSFKSMPLITVIDKRVAVLHGGIPRHIVSLERIGRLGKLKDVPTVQQMDEDDEIFCDVVWSDPVDRYKSRQLGGRHQGAHWRTSARGCGIEYLEGHTEAFTALNKLDMIVRSHEMVKGGYEVCHSGRCVTVFSASDYCGVSGNRAAIAIFSPMRTDPAYHTWFIKQDVSDELDLESSFNHMTGSDDGGQFASISQDIGISFDEQAIAMNAGPEEHSKIEADCVQQITELIWLKRYDLLSHFCSVDVEQVGYITKVEWCEVMKKVLQLPELPWYFLSPYLADVTLYREIPCIQYGSFLAAIDSLCGKQFEEAWLKCTVKAVFGNMELPDDLKPATKEQERLAQRRRSSLSELPSSHQLQQQRLPVVNHGPAPASELAGGEDNNRIAIPPAPPGAPQRTPSSLKIRLAGVVNFASERCESPVDSPTLKEKSSVASMNKSDAVAYARASSNLGQIQWQQFRFNFNYFVSILRAKSPAAAELEDSDFYVLFRHFDSDDDGHLVLGNLIEMVRPSGAHDFVSDDDDEDPMCSGSSSALLITPTAKNLNCETSPLTDAFSIRACESTPVAKWMYPTMLMLQRFFLFDKHRDLRVMFRFMDRDRDGVINLEDFKRAAHKMNRIISKPVEASQILIMFNTVCACGTTEKDVIDLSTFVGYFQVSPLRRRERQASEQSVTTVPLDHPSCKTPSDVDSLRQVRSSANQPVNIVVPHPHSHPCDELEMDSGSDGSASP